MNSKFKTIAKDLFRNPNDWERASQNSLNHKKYVGLNVSSDLRGLVFTVNRNSYFQYSRTRHPIIWLRFAWLRFQVNKARRQRNLEDQSNELLNQLLTTIEKAK